jgi:hypothetical protein
LHSSALLELTACLLFRVLLPPLLQLRNFAHLQYIAEARPRIYSKYISCDIAIQPVYWRVGRIYTKHSAPIVECWTVFTKLLPGNALIKSVTLFICSCLTTLVSSSDHTVSKGWMIGVMNCKGCERKRSCRNLRYYPCVCLELPTHPLKLQS